MKRGTLLYGEPGTGTVKATKEICPYCKEEVSQKQAGEDDWLDWCNTCDVLVEGSTMTVYESDKCPKCESYNIANENENEKELTCHDCSHQWTED